jgi:hypothetical protein
LRESGQIQAADGAGDVPERVAVRVTVCVGIRSRAGAHAVQDEDYRATRHRR